MSFFIGLLYVVEVIVCLLLALVVMLQKPKEGGLGGAVGGGMSEAVFGADASNVLIKVTIWLGSIFLVNTLLLARFTTVGHSGSSLMADVQDSKPTQEQQVPATPVSSEPLPTVEDLPAPAETKPEAKPAADAKPAAETKPKADAKPAAETKPKADVKPAADAKPKADVKPAAETKPKADAKPAADAKPKADVKPAADAKPKADAKPAASEKKK